MISRYTFLKACSINIIQHIYLKKIKFQVTKCKFVVKLDEKLRRNYYGKIRILYGRTQKIS